MRVFERPTDLPTAAVQAVIQTLVELAGSDNPACVVESIARYVD